MHDPCTNVHLDFDTMDERALADVAHAYYVQGETMGLIARRLSTSRSTVSRMLGEARTRGIVRISIHEPTRTPPALQRHLARLDITAHVVDVRPTATPVARLEAVARTTGHLVSDLMQDGSSLGIAWGTTTAAVVERLPAKPLRNASVIQLNGAASAATSGVSYAGDLLTRAAQAYGARSQLFPAPAFFDDPETRRMVWRETAVQRILELQRHLDIALFGVGSLTADLPSRVYEGQYLSDADLAELENEGVVGDICTVFIRENGTYADIAINDRATGPTPGQLRELPRRICAVSGRPKVPAIAGALRTRAMTDLVIDSVTAEALVAHLEHRPASAVRLPS